MLREECAMPSWRVLVLVFLSGCLAGCKLTITVPEGGRVESESGAWICRAGETCTIDIADVFFDETFLAVADEGYTFTQWRAERGYFCGGTATSCRVFTSLLAGNAALEALLDADLDFYLQPTFSGAGASTSHTVSPSGGSFEFSNGVVLDIPPGAVDSAVTLTISNLSSAVADPILSFHTRAITGKRYIGGFSVSPDVDFNIPITATFPVAALDPYEYPVQIEIVREEGKYWIEPTALEYRPDTGEVTMEVSHFSDIGTAAMQGLDSETLDIICTDPDLYDNEICEALDALQPAACFLKPEQRPPGTDCCREGLMSVRSEAIDFFSSRGNQFCEMLSDLVEVTYHECELPDGSVPTEVSDLCEMSLNCPQDEFLGAEVSITSSLPACYLKGDRLALQATVVDGDGNPLPSVGVQWRTADTAIASVSPSGVVTAKAAGQAIVEASYRRYCKDFAATAAIPVVDLVGNWSVLEIADERGCDEGVNTYQATVSLTQSGNQVTFSGPPGLNINGTRNGCGMQLAGSIQEDEGRTFGSGSATIDPEGNSITGSGSWTWRGIDPETGEMLSCSGSSQFTLTR